MQKPYKIMQKRKFSSYLYTSGMETFLVKNGYFNVKIAQKRVLYIVEYHEKNEER